MGCGRCRGKLQQQVANSTDCCVACGPAVTRRTKKQLEKQGVGSLLWQVDARGVTMRHVWIEFDQPKFRSKISKKKRSAPAGPLAVCVNSCCVLAVLLRASSHSIDPSIETTRTRGLDLQSNCGGRRQCTKVVKLAGHVLPARQSCGQTTLLHSFPPPPPAQMRSEGTTYTRLPHRA